MSHDALLARLARLDAQDRAWLLGELPPALRRELAGLLSVEDELPEEVVAPRAAAASWEALDAERVAQVLDAEPAWLVSAATRATETGWREQLLQGMSPRRRHEIEFADRVGRKLGARAANLVLTSCRTRLENMGPLTDGSARRTGFAALVAQMRSRFA